MAPISALLAALSLLSTVVASPVQSRSSPNGGVRLTKRLNIRNPRSILEADQARAKALFQKAQAISSQGQTGKTKRQTESFPVINEVVSYLAAVEVGSPPTTFDLIVDTGSSNTWVGATTAFTATSTTRQTGQQVSVTYGSGSFSGNEVIDQVTLGPGVVINSQSIGVATTSVGFAGVDGILGVGPTILTQGTLSPNVNAEIPTVTDNLASQGSIGASLLGISFEPTTQETVTNGEMTFGGVDPSKFTGNITFVPITKTSPSSFFWGIDQSITMGTTNILSQTAGIVDTGTTLVLLAQDGFVAYANAIGATQDVNTGLLTVGNANVLKNLDFHIGSTTFSLTPNAQIFPRSLNSLIGAPANRILLIVNSLGTPSGEGFDFVNGYTFLERFYSVFDTDNQRVGIATTSFTNANTN